MKIIAAGTLAGAVVLGLAACGSAAAPTRAVSAAPAVSAASPAQSATPESGCSVDCVDPAASGAKAWYAQVQAPLQQVSQDLSQISSDASSNPAELTVDGAQLSQDAQAVLNEETDPAPVDNSDFVAAMNDYIAAGNDYSGDTYITVTATTVAGIHTIAMLRIAVSAASQSNSTRLPAVTTHRPTTWCRRRSRGSGMPARIAVTAADIPVFQPKLNYFAQLWVKKKPHVMRRAAHLLPEI